MYPRLSRDEVDRLSPDERDAYESMWEDIAERRAADYEPVSIYDPTPSIHW